MAVIERDDQVFKDQSEVKVSNKKRAPRKKATTDSYLSRLLLRLVRLRWLGVTGMRLSSIN